MGTLYKIQVPVRKEANHLMPCTYKYKLDELVSENIDHFVLFISQFEKKSFEELKNETYSDFLYCNEILNNDETVKFEGIGSIRIFNKKVTLFPEENKNKSFGYPIINTKQ